ncbi:subtilisin-like protease SBT1.9 [Durio zibethinus]|uniref:Subtilisin-like protease SBT1.9 n=1 Tax=Durio zibethinus TaxID=66656 RepID=A0A6P6AV16_DURZI|nr:subtilisin-like protease SBT1.9 [Durio zibethinus]
MVKNNLKFPRLSIPYISLPKSGYSSNKISLAKFQSSTMAADQTKLLYVWLSFSISFIFTKLVQGDNYIVHMDLSAMPKAFSGQQSWYLATLASLSSNLRVKAPSSKLIYSYSHVIQGFSASLKPAELEALKNTPGYVSSIRDRTAKVDTTHSFKFLGLNSGTGAWPVSNFGKDVIIGVIDTGVWPESESFNDKGMTDVPSKWKGECESGTQFNSSMCNKKLIGARSFNKGLIAHDPNITISMNSPRDTEGHGTHTSTTAAGNYVPDASFFGYAMGTARGMAPGARVAMYKALWDEGAYTTDIIAAIDQAIADGVDVLSMSLGLDGLELYQDPIAVATFAAIEQNIFVSTSAGNEGPDVETLHNGTPWVITVAAGTMDRDFGATLSLGSKDSVNGVALYPGNFSSNEFPIVFMDACDNTSELRKIVQKIVVCQDPGKEDSLNDQFNNIQVAGNIAGVFITNNSDVTSYAQGPFPAVFLEQNDGDTVVDYIESNTDPKASIEFKKTFLGTKPSPTVTSYTSRGPSYSCPSVLKPDVMAPGDLVLAAWPPNIGVALVKKDLLFSNFNLLSGTSMACPHVTGVAALLKGAYPDWSPAAIRSALMTTADTIDNTGSPIKDIGENLQPANPLAMGAGQINPNKALDPGLIYDATVEDYVNLLCGLNFTEQQIKIITKSSSNNCSNPSLDLNYPSFIAYFNDRNAKPNSKTVKEFQRTVTNVGEGSSGYKATVTPFKGVKVTVEPDTLVFNAKNEKKNFKLSIEGPRQLDEAVKFGYLTWEDSGRKHVVRSPIVATSYIIEK